MSELDKLERALWTALAGNVAGRSRVLFHALDDLRFSRDLTEGRLTPADEVIPITGVDEFYQDSVRQAYRVLGITPAG